MARLATIAAALVASGALAAAGAGATEGPVVRTHGPACTAPRCVGDSPHPSRAVGFAAAALAAVWAGRRRPLRRS